MSSLSVQTSGAAREAVDRHVPALVGDRFASKLFAQDPTLWGAAAEDESAKRLGWVEAAEVSRPLVAEITEHAQRWAAQDELREAVEALDRPMVELPLMPGPMDLGTLFELADRLEEHVRDEVGRADRGVGIAARDERGAQRPAGASGGVVQ